MGAEIVPGETIPAVTGVTGVAVSFTKGCYPGQELVERMDSRGAEAPASLSHRRRRRRGAAGDPVVDAAARGRHRDERRLDARARDDQAWPRRRSSPGARLRPRAIPPLRAQRARRRRNSAAVGGGGGGEGVADRRHLGMVAEVRQLGRVVDDVRQAGRHRADVGGGTQPPDRRGLIAECAAARATVAADRVCGWRWKPRA